VAVPARSLAHGVKIQPTAVAPLYCDAIVEEEFWLQGGFDPSKKSGVGVDFELLVRCLLLGNKDAACKPS